MRKSLTVLTLATTALLVSSAGAVASDLGAADGCGPMEAAPDTDRPFITFGAQRSQPYFSPIRAKYDSSSIASAKSAGFEALVPSETKGLDNAFYVEGVDEWTTHLTSEPLGAADSVIDVLAKGGATITERATDYETIVVRAERMLKKSAPVQIGPYSGIISHGDEVAPGVRPFHVFWSDGKTDWSISSGMNDARDVVELARSMVCD